MVKNMRTRRNTGKEDDRGRELLGIFVLVIFSTILRFLVTNYDKIMSIYPDELIYYGVSKSIFNGTDILVHGNPTSIQNIAYSFFLIPFMMIEDSVIRIKVITFANGLLLASSVFPVWLICKELSLKKNDRILSVVIILLWPDMATSGVLMAENLYWPLIVWTIYFIIRFMRTEQIRYAIPAGMMSYLAYFCKEVAICLPLALVGYYVVYPAVQRVLFKENPRKLYNKRNLSGLIIYICVFAAGYIGAKKFLFLGGTNAYANENTVGLGAVMSAYNLVYMLYAFLYYLIAIILASGIFPVCYSIALYRYLDKVTQKVITFLLIFLSGSALVIAYTITVREELGTVAIRIHLRYIAMFVVIFIPLFFKAIQTVQQIESDVKWKSNVFLVLGIYWIVFLFIFKGVASGATTEHCAISYYDLVRSAKSILSINRENAYTFYPFAAVLNVLIVVLTYKINKHIIKKKSVMLFTIGIISACCINYCITERKIYQVHSANSEMVSEMSDINSWFQQNGAIHANVLYIGASGKFSQLRKTFDTYFDGTNILTISSERIDEHQRLLNDTIHVDDLKLTEVIWEKNYGNISNIEYIIAERAGVSGLTISNVDEIEEISADAYIVYRNLDSKKLTLTSPAPDMEIWFYGNNYNCNLYDLQGVSGREEEYTWTDGAKVSFNIPAAPGAASVHSCITVGGTYNGRQEYSIISGSQYLLSDAISGGGKIEFDVPVIDGQIRFDIFLPNAVSPKEKGESEDARKLSLQLLNASFTYVN